MQPDLFTPVGSQQSSMSDAQAKDRDFGEVLYERLTDARNLHGGKLNREQFVKVANATAKECGLAKRRNRVGGRDLLFDALCVACGINANEVTRMAATGIGTALADIAAVTPDLTPEEFGIRAAKYRREHPDWELTPTALCTHWGELGKGDVGQTTASMHAKEPEGWQEVAREMFREGEWSEGSIAFAIQGGWSSLSLIHRKAIQHRLLKFFCPKNNEA